MYDLKYLCFMSVCETNNFSSTATELMLTQQAVSRHIQKLEEELGFRLFIRDQNMVSPTLAGRELLRFLNESNERFQEISLHKQSDVQILRIAISEWLGNIEWLKEATLKFRKRNPDIQLVFCVISSEKAREMLEHRLLDGFLTTSYSLTKLNLPCEKKAIFQSPLCLLTSADFVSKEVHLAATSGEMGENCVKARELRLCQELGISLQQMKVLINYNSVLWNVSMGNGRCFAPACNKITENAHVKCKPLEFLVDVELGIFSRKRASILNEFSECAREVLA